MIHLSLKRRRSDLVDEPELQQVVIAVLEMRSLPLPGSERTEYGVNMNRTRLFAEMIDKASEFLSQCGFRVNKAGEPKWERVLTE